MSDTNDEEVVAVDPLDLSDEDFAKLDIETLAPEEAPAEEVAEIVEKDEDPEDESGEEDPSTTDDGDATDDEAEAEEDPEEAADKEAEPESEKPGDDTSEEETDVKVEKEVASEEVTPESQLEKIFTPFKANGREVKIDNVEDAITLMQKGANYEKKMAGLKPNLKLLKMLENNKLLDESKLNYLIDLSNKDPEAIKKLVKDSGIDPLDIDVRDKTEYKPKSYTVDDRDVELDGILGDIQDTDSYKETLNIISNKWDNSSKEALYNNPDVIKVLNGHVESGVYQQITGVIESERMLGRLRGLTDIQAYQQVGKAIEAQGGFNAPASNVAATEKTPVKKAVDPKLKQRKKAASSTKSSVSKKKEQTFNPLALSDDEFEKLSANSF